MNTPDTCFIDCLNYLHGRMTVEEQRAFQARMRTDAAVRQLLMEVALEEMQLAEIAADQSAAAPGRILRFAAPKLAWRRWRPAGLAAAAALLVLGSLWGLRTLWSGADAAQQLQVAQVAGEVFAGANEHQMVLAKTGDRLAPGTLVVTGGRGSSCSLQLGQQVVRIDVDAESTLVWKGGARASEDGLAVELLSGKVTSSVDPAKKVKYTVRTGVGFARVVGTVFTVALTRTGTKEGDVMRNQATMVTRVLRGIVLVGSMTGFASLVHAGETAAVGGAVPAAVPVVANLQPPAQLVAAPAQPSALDKKLDSIKIDEVNFQQTIADAVQFLYAAAKTNDPDKVGVNIVLADKENNAKISMSASGNMSLRYALSSVAEIGGLTIDATGSDVVLRKVTDAERVERAADLLVRKEVIAAAEPEIYGKQAIADHLAAAKALAGQPRPIEEDIAWRLKQENDNLARSRAAAQEASSSAGRIKTVVEDLQKELKELEAHAGLMKTNAVRYAKGVTAYEALAEHGMKAAETPDAAVKGVSEEDLAKARKKVIAERLALYKENVAQGLSAEQEYNAHAARIKTVIEELENDQKDLETRAAQISRRVDEVEKKKQKLAETLKKLRAERTANEGN